MRKVLRYVLAVVGLGIGCGIVAIVLNNVTFPGYQYVMQYTTQTAVLIAVYVVVGFIFGLIAYVSSPGIIDGVSGCFKRFEQRLTEMPAMDILFGVVGMIIGLIFAFLLSLLVGAVNVPVLPDVIMLLLYCVLGYYGGRIGITRRKEFMSGAEARRNRLASGAPSDGSARPKVLDTSVIIDGRIFDVCKTGFVEGALIVPAFVLKELRHIADNTDALKRNRGRRGLDVIKEMQQQLSQPVEISETDYDDVDEVDLKLLRLAGDIGGVLVTNDYNLYKVAAVQNTPVLNINDLANAIRPVLLPGENLTIAIVKEGKEHGQGVGYLADGTMVIVENGKRNIGEEAEITVTSALQTSAGRMIFAKLK